MRSRLLVGTVAVLGIGVGACGGSGSRGGGTTHRAAVPGAGSRPTQIFRVRMSGALEITPAAKNGGGAAVIAFHGASRICWRFAHLHGFTDATSARLDAGPMGRAGTTVIMLSPGPRLRHQGCVPVNPTLSKKIVAQPADYYVSIQSKQYPHGAVRAQL